MACLSQFSAIGRASHPRTPAGIRHERQTAARAAVGIVGEQRFRGERGGDSQLTCEKDVHVLEEALSLRLVSGLVG